MTSSYDPRTESKCIHERLLLLNNSLVDLAKRGDELRGAIRLREEAQRKLEKALLPLYAAPADAEKEILRVAGDRSQNAQALVRQAPERFGTLREDLSRGWLGIPRLKRRVERDVQNHAQTASFAVAEWIPAVRYTDTLALNPVTKKRYPGAEAALDAIRGHMDELEAERSRLRSRSDQLQRQQRGATGGQ